MTHSVGVRLGPYEIAGLLGAGGMGEVYRARDTRLHRDVAIKVLAGDVAHGPEVRQRFEREARAVAALNHPHICTVYDVSPDYLVMEMLDGQPLAGPLPLARALVFARQILSALAAAHSKGITHRDLKPDNILVTGEGIKLLDFGLAKLATDLADATSEELATPVAASMTVTGPLTREHTIVGTVQYMSPEQARGEPVDARSDFFSFGLVLYEMLMGRRAFDGTDPASVIAAILEREAPSVAAVAPRALDGILHKCLAKEPSERWQTARDILHALDLVDDTPTTAVPSRSRWRVLAVASLAGFLAASALGTALAVSWQRPSVGGQRLSFRLSPPPGAEFGSSTASGGSAISPDGRTVAFVAVTNGTPRLWIRALESLTARELQDTDGAKLPFWSPDSRSLGFFTNGDLRRIDAAGGAATVLARAPDPRGGAWNASGTIVFSPAAAGPLQRISSSGGMPSPLTTMADGQSSHRWPQFLPDGRTLLYFVSGAKDSVYVTTLDRPSEGKRLLDVQSQATYVARPGNGQGYLLWVVRESVVAQPFDPAATDRAGASVSIPGTEGVSSFSGTGRASVTVSNDGTLLYSTGGSRYQLAWFGSDGTPLGTVAATDQYIGLRVSPKGDEALVTIRDPAANGDIWRVDLASGARSRVTSEGRGWYAVWAPDSQEIAFSPQGLNNPQVTAARGGGQARRLWTSSAPVYPSDWSRDGRYLAYTESHADTSNDVWLFPMFGEGKPIAVLRSPYTEFHAQFSPDGRWLAFTSNESGPDNVYVQSLADPGTRRLVSSGGGAYPRWGPQGRELWYRAADGQLMTVPVRTVGRSMELGTASAILRLVDPPGVHPYPYDVAPDGRILALVPATEGARELTVLMNWQAALEP